METIDIGAIKRPSGWSPIRRELDVHAFGVNAWSGGDGDDLVGEHDEAGSGHEELYVVLSGAARFTVDGEERDVTAGTVVLVREPASRRKAVATSPGTTVVSVVGKPGE